MSRMKDSGVAYLGDIDSKFDTATINSLFTIKKDIIGHEPDLVLSITQKGIRPKDIESNEGQIAASYANYQMVNIGDFAMNHMDLITGGIDISKYNGVTSPDYRVFVLKDKEMVDRYFLYVFQLYYKTRTFFGFGQGVANLGRWRLPANNFKNIIVPLPAVNIQKKIVCILDSQCEMIDRLISNVRAQIEKLKAYKQSVITEIVTKGLDPFAPMKDSGVEWIGEIPEHWEVRRIKHIADPNIENSYIDGDWIESPFITDNGIRYYTTGNVGDGAFKHQGNGYISEETFAELNCKYAYPGDLVISRLNEPYGRSCILPNDVERCIIAVDVVILRPSVEFNKQYLCYQTQMPNYHAAVGEKARGTAMKRISRFNLGNIFLIVPPKHEQDTMAHLLDEKCRRVDQLITIKQKKIDKLNEYKKSLIYEYVTGKKEVS